MNDEPPRGPRTSRPKDVERWLGQQPSLTEMADAFPQEWSEVQRELDGVSASSDPKALERYLASLAAPGPRGAARRGGDVAQQVQRQMAARALQQARLATSTGITAGKVRFGLVNGYLSQKLLFRRGLERKPVSMGAFRLLWPLLRERRYLMPLVEPKGIYCFYSRALVKELARLIDGRPALEIAAGDGTLTRFLAEEGAKVTAVDDHSWSHAIEYPPAVLRQDAKSALETYRPRVVICSFPPPGNEFERHVFKTRTVELYVVIGSTSEFAAGNWADYRRQTAFAFEEDERLSRLVLPPEISPAVYVFRRGS